MVILHWICVKLQMEDQIDRLSHWIRLISWNCQIFLAPEILCYTCSWWFFFSFDSFDIHVDLFDDYGLSLMKWCILNDFCMGYLGIYVLLIFQLVFISYAFHLFDKMQQWLLALYFFFIWIWIVEFSNIIFWKHLFAWQFSWMGVVMSFMVVLFSYVEILGQGV